ncbi:MAG TPA: hypothetical protein VFQ07_05855 [Candidatus Polarisedimenticolia bacterium]|nr:hypothetical protein [Candidatus Polarisedimenticolia bacterium]
MPGTDADAARASGGGASPVLPADAHEDRLRALVAILLAGAVLLIALALSGLPARAEEAKKDEPAPCTMTFTLKGWSAFYKTASGEGTITCRGGGSMKVKITAKGGGFTFGKSEITDGTGRFFNAKSVEDCLGSYAQSEAHAGAGKSADAQALTKGDINLTLTGTGKGVDVGFAFGKFTIEKL